MFCRSFVLMLLAIVLAVQAGAQDSSPFGPKDVAKKDSLVSYCTYVEPDSLLDTVVVVTAGKPDRRIPVNKYVEAVNIIAFPGRHRFDIGFWNMRATEGLRAAPNTYSTGTWKSFGSVSAGKNVRLLLRTRDGRVTDVTPRRE